MARLGIPQRSGEQLGWRGADQLPAPRGLRVVRLRPFPLGWLDRGHRRKDRAQFRERRAARQFRRRRRGPAAIQRGRLSSPGDGRGSAHGHRHVVLGHRAVVRERALPRARRSLRRFNGALAVRHRLARPHGVGSDSQRRNPRISPLCLVHARALVHRELGRRRSNWRARSSTAPRSSRGSRSARGPSPA